MSSFVDGLTRHILATKDACVQLELDDRPAPIRIVVGRPGELDSLTIDEAHELGTALVRGAHAMERFNAARRK